tara:strand:+ start:2170 stop:4383 length:2214 start_codon:yes stop_codon:yes gene_type:complete
VAKLVPYKQVKRNGSKSVKGALKKAVNTNIFAANQLGSTLNSVGNITTDLVKISEAFRKTRLNDEKDERRQKRLDKDQAAEDRQEGKKVDDFNKSGKDKDTEKEFKKKKKPKMSLFKKGKGMGGFLLGFLGPVGGALASIAAAAATYKLMEYFSKPENTEKIREFIEKASFVFKKLFGWAGQLIDATMTAVDQLFGKEKSIGERLLGFGKIATAIGANLMLLKAYEGISDFLDRDKPKNKNKNKKPEVDPDTGRKLDADEIIDPETGKTRKADLDEIELKKKGLNSDQIADYKKQVANGVDPDVALKKSKQGKLQRMIGDKIDDVATSKPVKNIIGFFKDLGKKVGKFAQNQINKIPGVKELGEKLTKAIAQGYQDLSKFARKKFDDIVSTGKKLKGMYDNALKSTGNFFKKMAKRAKDAVVKKILEPALQYFEPALKKLKAVGGKIMKQLQKIPGYDKITKVLKKFGGEGSQGLLKKIGGKAVPILGGFVNMLFAYDRLASGDSIGGLLEGASGILDLSGAFGNAAGPPISMGIDAFMFARDFVPQIQEGEEAIVNKLGLGGLKTQMDSIFEKLPDLGTITNMVLGKKKEEETGDGDTISPDGETVTTNVRKISAKLDLYGDGKAYINGNEVSLEEYQAFQEMTREEQLLKYGSEGTGAENVAEEMASGGLLRVPQPAYFSAGGLSDQIAMASAFSNMIPIPIVISKLETIPTPVAINTGGGTKVAYMSSISTRRL